MRTTPVRSAFWDDDGNPVSGAAVVVKGSNTGEISDAKGFVRFRNIRATPRCW